VVLNSANKRLERFTPQFLLMRLRHATTEQDDLSEALASSFVRSTSSETAATPASGKEVDDFVKEFRELRKTYHKRVMWGDRWSNGQVAWRDD
jgi:ESCRT-I complex subunit VPS37